MGFSFVSTCSKCDYYLQSWALNMKAQTLPRYELSKMWQCTTLHTVGDLHTSQSEATPYWSAKVTKLNSYICSDRSSSRSSSSLKSKQVQLFATSPNSDGNNNNVETPSSMTLQTDCTPMLRAEFQRANAERDLARAERDFTRSERDAARAERDAAVTNSDKANAERDAAFIERDIAHAALCERILLAKEAI
jgi:hypothetical protein